MQPGWKRILIRDKPVDLLHIDGSRLAVLFLHPVGGESPAENAVFTAAFMKHGISCCAPWGARSWWSDRLCLEFDREVTAEKHLLHHVLPGMLSEWQLSPKSIAVAGISMGGQGALRLGFKYPERFPVVGSIAGAIDYYRWHGQGTPIDEIYETAEQCRLDSATLHLDPNAYPPHIFFACDPADHEWYQGNDRLQEKLRAFGVPHVADLESTAGGHGWEYFESQAEPLLEFLKSSLVARSRKLL